MGGAVCLLLWHNRRTGCLVVFVISGSVGSGVVIPIHIVRFPISSSPNTFRSHCWLLPKLTTQLGIAKFWYSVIPAASVRQIFVQRRTWPLYLFAYPWYGSHGKGRIKGKNQHCFFIFQNVELMIFSSILLDVVNILFDAQPVTSLTNGIFFTLTPESFDITTLVLRASFPALVGWGVLGLSCTSAPGISPFARESWQIGQFFMGLWLKNLHFFVPCFFP